MTGRPAGAGLAALALALGLLGCGDGAVEALNPASGEVRAFDSAAQVPAGWIVCGASCDAVDAGAPVAPAAELGTGDLEFEAIEDGQELDFILGPQGGYHFLASVRVQGLEPGNPDMLTDPRNPTVEFRAFVGERRIDVMASRYVQGLDPAVGAEGFEMVGRLLILDIRSCEELEGMPVQLEVAATDVNGVSVRDQRTVTAVPNPFNR